MESFIIGLFDKVVDPAIVSFHGSEASEMSTHASNHTGNTGDGFKEKASGDPFSFGHVLWFIPGEVVIRFPDELDGRIGDFVLEGLGFKMFVLNFLYL